MAPKKPNNKPKRKYTRRRKTNTKSKLGLNNVERSQVSKMIKGKRETFYLQTIQYQLGQGVQTALQKHQLTPSSCFQSANRITMIGLLSADTFNNIGNDVK